jgi:hypothetical protein
MPASFAAIALACALAIAAVASATASAEGSRHVQITGEGVPEQYRASIAATIEAARQVCVDQYGFDMPDVIHVAVSLGPKNTVRLFNDGADRFSLSVKTERDLKQPSQSGVFHIYGLCHEVAHLAMYRPIADHSWLTTAGAEGWAHWLGSSLVDAVYERKGEGLWPDRYDYREDGTRRLDRQLAAGDPSDVARGARLWGDLAEIVGRENLAEVFIAWGQADVDPAQPREVLEKSLAQFGDAGKLAAWWNAAAPVLLLSRESSKFPLSYASRSDLVNEPRELAVDDGEAAGKKSLAGGGHGVVFDVPDNSWHLTAVSIHGSRYGAPQPPKEDFEVFLCDADFNLIASYKFPYSKFARGKEQWVKLAVRPTNVPQRFIVGAGFNPTATKGVYVSHDGEGSGKSVTGLPGRGRREFPQGDWLIRVEINQSKAADAFTPGT